jgi:hypothetical protein
MGVTAGGACGEGGYSPYGVQEGESKERTETKFSPQRHATGDLPSPTKSHPLRFPEPPKINTATWGPSDDLVGDISYSSRSKTHHHHNMFMPVLVCVLLL